MKVIYEEIINITYPRDSKNYSDRGFVNIHNGRMGGVIGLVL